MSHVFAAIRRTAGHHPEGLSVATKSDDSSQLDTPDGLPFILVTNAEAVSLRSYQFIGS